jgi:dTDP-4-dehydrorhamnose reductase
VRILVIGGLGMLGHKVYQRLSDQFDTFATVRAYPPQSEALGLFRAGRLVAGVDAGNIATVDIAIDQVRPDAVINCVGIVKKASGAKNPIASISINAMFPHLLESLCTDQGTRLIHVSTDCVFSGKHGYYVEDDYADPVDLYGRTKHLGEVCGANSLTIRTSIIGREIAGANGLVEWFLAQRGRKVSGYTNAIFSGFPTVVLADLIGAILREHTQLKGMYHVSADPISKYDLLMLLREAYDVPIEIEPDSDVQIDRSLDSRRFRRLTGYQPPSWTALVAELVSDPTPYGLWREQQW